MAKQSISKLKAILANAKVRTFDADFMVRMDARDEVKKLEKRIARRERDEAMRDMGLVKVRGNLGGTYWE